MSDDVGLGVNDEDPEVLTEVDADDEDSNLRKEQEARGRVQPGCLLLLEVAVTGE